MVELKNPTLILGVGNSACGKTTHLLELTKILKDSFWIDKDTIEDTFLLKMDNSTEDIEKYNQVLGRYSRKENYHLTNVELQAYLLMLLEAKNNLLLGKHPIIDGNYVRELQKNYIEKIIKPLLSGINYKLKILYFHCPEGIMKERIIKRANPRDEKKIKDDSEWKTFLEKEPIIVREIESYDHLKIDSTNNLQENISKIIDYLTSGN